MNGDVPNSEVVKGLAVRHDDGDEALRQRALSAPGLAQTEDDVRLGR